MIHLSENIIVRNPDPVFEFLQAIEERRDSLVGNHYEERELLFDLKRALEESLFRSIEWAASQFYVSSDPAFLRDLYSRTILHEKSALKTAYALVAIMRGNVRVGLRVEIFEIAQGLKKLLMESWGKNKIPHTAGFREVLEILQLLPHRPGDSIRETDLLQSGEKIAVDAKEFQARLKEFNRLFRDPQDLDEDVAIEFLDELSLFFNLKFIPFTSQLFKLYAKIDRLCEQPHFDAALAFRLIKLRSQVNDSIEESLSALADSSQRFGQGKRELIRLLSLGFQQPATAVFTANLILSLSSPKFPVEVRQVGLDVHKVLMEDFDERERSGDLPSGIELRKAKSILKGYELQRVLLKRDIFLLELEDPRLSFGTREQMARLEALIRGELPAQIDLSEALRIRRIVEDLRDSGEIELKLRLPVFSLAKNRDRSDEVESVLISFYAGLVELFRLMRLNPQNPKEEFMLIQFFKQYRGI